MAYITDMGRETCQNPLIHTISARFVISLYVGETNCLCTAYVSNPLQQIDISNPCLSFPVLLIDPIDQT